MNKLRKAYQWTINAIDVDINDVFWVSGLTAVGYGIAQIYIPAAWIVCGTVVFFLGIRR